MTEIIFLGTGGALATGPADDHTALVVRHDGATILLDAGPTVVRQLARCRLTVGDLTHVYVSHQHGDHALGFPMVLLQRVIFWPDRPLVVLGAAPVLQALEAMAGLAYPDLIGRAEPVLDFLTLDEKAAPAALPHAPTIRCTIRPGLHTVPVWGVRLDLGSQASLAYSSDTAPAPGIAALAAGVDLLVHESFYVHPVVDNGPSHSAASQVGEMAAAAGVRRLALVHRMDTGEEAAQSYRTAAAAHFAGPILVPQGGDRLTL